MTSLTVHPRFIERGGRRAYVVLTNRDWRKLIDALEMAEDVRRYDEAVAEEGESVPVELVKRLVDGAHPLKVYREHRGLTQAALAKAIRIAPLYVSQIETGVRKASVRMLKRLAKALRVEWADLVPRDED